MVHLRNCGGLAAQQWGNDATVGGVEALENPQQAPWGAVTVHCSPLRNEPSKGQQWALGRVIRLAALGDDGMCLRRLVMESK